MFTSCEPSAQVIAERLNQQGVINGVVLLNFRLCYVEASCEESLLRGQLSLLLCQDTNIFLSIGENVWAVLNAGVSCIGCFVFVMFFV